SRRGRRRDTTPGGQASNQHGGASRPRPQHGREGVHHVVREPCRRSSSHPRLRQFRRIIAPLTVTTALALRSMFVDASTLTPSCDFISMPLACIVSLPIADLIVMSDFASMVMVFAALSMTILL